MKHFCFCILLCMYSLMSVAQTDSIRYYSKNGKSTSKDSAYYYATVSYSDGLYKRKDYNYKTDRLYRYGEFLDRETKTRHGVFRVYYENGMLRDSVIYNNGKLMAGKYFYESGSKKASLSIVDGKPVAQGWDENGNEIQDYIINREAEFPGGKVGWRKYLEKHLDANTAGRARVPVGDYPVKVSFIVGEDGKLSDIEAMSYPVNCMQCAVEAIRVIQKGPDWNPAIQFGKPVIYKAIQYVTFQVANN